MPLSAGDHNAKALEGLSVIGVSYVCTVRDNVMDVCCQSVALGMQSWSFTDCGWLVLLGVSQIDRIVEAVEETLKGNTIHMLAKKALPRLDLPKVSLPVSIVCLPADMHQNTLRYRCTCTMLSEASSAIEDAVPAT